MSESRGCEDTMKIGILTYHRANNYGAFLQAQALCCRLNQESGIDAEIIDYRMKAEEKQYSYGAKIKKWIKNPAQIKFDIQLKTMFEHAYDQTYGKLSAGSCTSDSIEEFQKFLAGKYDVVIAGSDEIWKLDGFRGFPSPYWLPGDLQCRKFSYAASSRSEFSKLSKEKYREAQKLLNDFEVIGVRDISTYNEVKQVASDEADIKLYCDPSFLYDFPIETKAVAEILKFPRQLNTRKKNLLLMTADKTLADYVYRTFGDEYNLISVFHWNKGFYNIGKLTPWQWLLLIKNVDFIITTYFHATCFSIIFNTPFIAFGAKNKSSKLEELLQTDSLARRYISDIEQFVKKSDAKAQVEERMQKEDFSEIIENYREEFKHFLRALR